MKIILDMNLSPSWISLLETKGYETKHWKDIGPVSAFLIRKLWNGHEKNGYVVFTHDLDFGALLYATKATAPSVIQLRSEDIRPRIVGEIILQTLCKAEKAIEQGALVIVEPRKSRIRLLPLKNKNR